jgi:hypothetical protein
LVSAGHFAVSPLNDGDGQAIRRAAPPDQPTAAGTGPLQRIFIGEPVDLDQPASGIT